MMLNKALIYIKKMNFRLGEARFVIRKSRTNDEALRK